MVENTSATGSASVGFPGNVPPPPPPAADDGPNWAAVFALVISIITFIKTLYSDFRTSRRKDSADFEAAIGSAVRTALRDFDKTLKTLRSFTLPNPKSLQEQKAEVESLADQWIGGAFEISRLLVEVDAHPLTVQPDWNERFSKYSSAAEDAILEMEGAADAAELRSCAQRAYEQMCCGISEMRTALTHQQRSFDSWFDKMYRVFWRQQ